MTHTRTALVCLIATLGLSACATMDTAQEAELDLLSDALEDAVLAGDYELAMQLGHDFVGLPIEGNGPDGEPTITTGLIAGVIEPGDDISTVSMLRGRMIDPDSGDRHQIFGELAQPLQDQIRGLVHGETHMRDVEIAGTLNGDFRTVGDAEDHGTLRAVWRIEGDSTSRYIRAQWETDSDGSGRVFGTWTALETPVWEDGVRIRIPVAGLTQVTISETQIWVTPLDEEDLYASPHALVNGEQYDLVYGELSCPDAADPSCNTEPYNAPEGAVMDMSAGVRMTTFVGRGGVALAAQPSADNNYETRVVISDLDYQGSSVYEIQLTPAD